MRNIRWYNSAVRADQAAAFLRRHGILAGAVHHNIDFSGGVVAKISGSGHGVSILAKQQEAVAQALLDEFEALPTDADDGQWEDAAEADLSKLDPRLLPGCPSCGERLPADASIEACPSCKAPVDVAELIVAEHGPEVLADCYGSGEPEDGITEELLAQAAVDCPNCGYLLEQLGVSGRCPECGREFDKRAMLARMLGLEPGG